MSKNRKDYEVGWGRPPVKSRWKPGQSGNPKGRRKGSKNHQTILESLVHQKITVHEGGRSRTMSKFEVAAMQLINKAVGGDLKAFEFIWQNFGQISDPPPPPHHQIADLEKITDPVRAADAYRRMIASSEGFVTTSSKRTRR